MKFYIILLFLSFNIFADSEKEIVCGFQQCVPNFSSNLYLEKSDKTVIDVTQNEEDVTVSLPENQEPRELYFFLDNSTISGKKVNFNLNSKLKEKDSANLIFIGNKFSEINITLDGFVGQEGQDASIICANKFLSGEYGDSSKNYFLNRRINNENLSSDRCDDLDVEHIQNTKFQCQNDSFKKEDFPTVDVKRVKFKQRCVGNSIRYKCVKRKVKMTCEWYAQPKGRRWVDKYNKYYCSNQWGASNCYYARNESCWLGRNLQGAGTYPSTNTNPKWRVNLSENSRCNLGSAKRGGAFAYQTSDDLNEFLYVEANKNGTVNQLCEQLFPHPTGDAWRFSQVKTFQYTEPGLDPDTLLPLPGSSWLVQYSDFFMPCSDLGSFTTLNSEIKTWSTHGEIGLECQDVSVPEDVNNLIPWTKSGIDQDPSFGSETLLCNPTNCPVKNIISDKSLSFDTIDPTIGANGTSQGNGLLFIYDFDKINASANPGLSGNGGSNDLPILEEKRYCVRIDDASSMGLNSSFAKNPIVNYNIYDWKGLDIKKGQAGGVEPDYSSNNIIIYRKLDSSVRYLLKNSLIID